MSSYQADTYQPRSDTLRSGINHMVLRERAWIHLSRSTLIRVLALVSFVILCMRLPCWSPSVLPMLLLLSQSHSHMVSASKSSLPSIHSRWHALIKFQLALDAQRRLIRGLLPKASRRVENTKGPCCYPFNAAMIRLYRRNGGRLPSLKQRHGPRQFRQGIGPPLT